MTTRRAEQDAEEGAAKVEAELDKVWGLLHRPFSLVQSATETPTITKDQLRGAMFLAWKVGFDQGNSVATERLMTMLTARTMQ